MNIFKPQTENSVGKAIFYIFEVCAIIVGLCSLILTIYYTVNYNSFMAFISYLTPTIVDTLVVFGIGKLIDLLYCKKSCNAPKQEEKKEEKEEA